MLCTAILSLLEGVGTGMFSAIRTNSSVLNKSRDTYLRVAQHESKATFITSCDKLESVQPTMYSYQFHI